MTDKKDDNIIIGPWDAHGKVNDEQASDWVKRKYQKALDKNNTQLKMQEKMSKIDIITEGVMVQLIHTLSENGYDIGEDSFILDLGLTNLLIGFFLLYFKGEFIIFISFFKLLTINS